MWDIDNKASVNKSKGHTMNKKHWEYSVVPEICCRCLQLIMIKKETTDG